MDIGATAGRMNRRDYFQDFKVSLCVPLGELGERARSQNACNLLQLLASFVSSLEGSALWSGLKGVESGGQGIN